MSVNVKDLVERLIWTAVATAGGVFGAASLAGYPSLADWKSVGSAAGIAALVSVAKTLGVSASTASADAQKVDTVAKEVEALPVPAVVKTDVAKLDAVVDSGAHWLEQFGSTSGTPVVTTTVIPAHTDVKPNVTPESALQVREDSKPAADVATPTADVAVPTAPVAPVVDPAAKTVSAEEAVAAMKQ